VDDHPRSAVVKTNGALAGRAYPLVCNPAEIIVVPVAIDEHLRGMECAG